MVLCSDSVEVANLQTCNSRVRYSYPIFNFAISAAVSSSRKYASACSAFVSRSLGGLFFLRLLSALFGDVYS